MARKKILMLVEDGAEDYQVMVPFQTLQMVGHHVHVVCPGKGEGESIQTVLYDSTDAQPTSEKPGHAFLLNASFSSVTAEDYDALLIPGGRAPAALRLDAQVIHWVRHFARANKPIAAIGHGPQVLAAAGVLKGRLCTAHPAVRAELERAGARWAATNSACTNADVDGNLITAPSWSAHPQWLAKFITLLGSRVSA